MQEYGRAGWKAMRHNRLYRSLSPGFTYANSAVIDIDDVLHRGTQEYALRGGRGSGATPI